MLTAAGSLSFKTRDSVGKLSEHCRVKIYTNEVSLLNNSNRQKRYTGACPNSKPAYREGSINVV
jgi:hypothetical protein